MLIQEHVVLGEIMFTDVKTSKTTHIHTHTKILPFVLTVQTSWTYFSFFYEDGTIPVIQRKCHINA